MVVVVGKEGRTTGIPESRTGDHSAWLQGRESKTLIIVLESLARQGVLALPLLDAVIAPARSRELVRRVMDDAHEALNGHQISAG